LIAALSFAAFVTTTIVTSKEVGSAGSVAVDNQESLEAIERAIEGIQGNQEGIDVLVNFVRDMQAQPEEEPANLQVFIDLLCSSEDPVRLAACAKLGEDPLGTGDP
jgi:hypothetical protein